MKHFLLLSATLLFTFLTIFLIVAPEYVYRDGNEFTAKIVSISLGVTVIFLAVSLVSTRKKNRVTLRDDDYN